MYFSNQYQITFLPETDPLELVTCLRDRFNDGVAETPGEQPALQLLYLHAVADDDTRMALDKAISRLKSVHNIASASIHDLLAGADIATARRKMVEEANLIIAILSADYTAEDWLIGELSPLASAQHGSERTRMAAVYAREAFGVTDEFLRLGIPVLPAGDIPVSDMNPDKAYQKIAEALQKIIEGML